MATDFYDLDFFDLKRKLPVTLLSPKLMMANFNILGDIELTEKAVEKLEEQLRKRNIIPDCFVGPEVKVVPLIHEIAKRFGHKRYVVLRKSIRGYMNEPIVEHPWETAPKHVKKLVLSGVDKDYLTGKKVVLIDDVVSTGVTIQLLNRVMQKIGANVIGECAIFKQGDRYNGSLIYLKELPLMVR